MAQFTEHSGDPAWLKSQRDAQARTRPQSRVHRAMPYPTQAPAVTPTSSDRGEFVRGAKTGGNEGTIAFVLGFLAVRQALKGRRR